jgi:PKD repeat protein
VEEVAKKKETAPLEKLQEIEIGGKAELPAVSNLPETALPKELGLEKIPPQEQVVPKEIAKETMAQEAIETMPTRADVTQEKSTERPKQKIKVKQKRIVTATTSQPKAVIVAKPQKGYSPLVVHFNGTKSTSSGARIVSYSWDFGDGDTSNKPKPVNMYYSGSYEPRHFTATLTVRDNKGNSATTSLDIEVLNK